MGTPVHIYKNINGKYQIIVKEIESILDKVGDLPVAIYSINGPFRYGKSFLLNFMLKYLECNGKKEWIEHDLQSSFAWRSGAKRETTGIMMWSEPFIIRKNGSEVALLLMDTQGSFDDQTTMQENAIVFALSTLLSSQIIFNLKDRIGEDLLQYLQYFAGFARLADEENKDEPFQKLIFLIRDWPHPEYEYGYHDDNTNQFNNYKRDTLNTREDQPKDVKYVHKMILSDFLHVGCYLMPYPGVDVARYGKFDINTVEPEFLKHLKIFVSQMLNTDNIIEKKIGGSHVTGKHLKKFVRKWENIFRSDEIPESKNVFQAAAEIQHEIAKSAAVENYTRKMKELITGKGEGLPDDTFNDIHKQVLNESLDLYKCFPKIGAKEYGEIYKKKLEEEITIQYQFFCQLNCGSRKLREIEVEMNSKCTALEREINSNKAKYEEMMRQSDAELKQINVELQNSKSTYENIKRENEEERKRLKQEIDRQALRQQEIIRECEAEKERYRIERQNAVIAAENARRSSRRRIRCIIQ